MSARRHMYSRIKMNYLGPAGLSIVVFSFIMFVLSLLCVLKVLFTPVWGAILGILSLVSAAVGLTMAVIARNEIVANVQTGDEFAVSGMVVGIVMCTLSSAILTIWFILFT